MIYVDIASTAGMTSKGHAWSVHFTPCSGEIGLDFPGGEGS